MARSGQFKVYITADSSGVQRGVKGAERSLSSLGKSAKGVSQTFRLLKGAVGFIAFNELAKGVKSTVTAFTDSERVAKQTQAVLKSTGGAAGVTAKQVSDLATAISRKTATDDEAVASAENLLLTFTNIRNEAGKGNDVFNQTTKTVVDMSAALGTDLKSSSIQVGKALNDPIKGITALTRVGVSFTAGQKEQIKSMVESGNRLGAQKLILKELNKEFGGSAKAAATPLKMLAVEAENVQESLGGKLAPAAMRAAKGVLALIAQARAGTGTGGKLAAAFSAVGRTIKGAATAVVSIVNYFRNSSSAMTALLAVVGGLTAGFIALRVALGIQAIITGVTTGFAILTGVIAANPLGALALAAVAVGAALVVLYKRSETFRNAVAPALSFVKSIGVAAFNALKSAAQTVGSALARAFQSAGPALRAFAVIAKTYLKVAATEFKILLSVGRAIFSAIGTVVKAAATVIGAVIKTLVTSVKTTWNGLRLLQSVARTIFSAVAAVFKTYLSIASVAVRTAVRAIKAYWDGISALATKARSVMSAVVNAIKAVISRAAAAAKSVVSAIVNAFGALTKVVSKVVSVGSSIVSAIGRWGSNFYSAAFSVGKRIVEAIVNAVKELPSRLAGIGAAAGRKLKDSVKGAAGGAIKSVIPGLAVGGRVDGAQLAVVGEGRAPEYIIPTDPALLQTRGLPLLLAAAEEMGVTMFAKGGRSKKKSSKKSKSKKKSTKASVQRSPAAAQNVYTYGYEQQLADNDLAFANAEGTASSADDIKVLDARKFLLQSHLRELESSINATKKKLRSKQVSGARKANLKEALKSYTDDASSTKNELNSVISKLAELRNPASTDTSDYGDISDYETVAAAVDDPTDSSTSDSDTADLEARLAQAELKTYVAQRASALSDAFIKTALSPGDIGRGGQSALTVNIQSLTPADSSTLSTVGQYVLQAFNAQGSVTASTVSLAT